VIWCAILLALHLLFARQVEGPAPVAVQNPEPDPSPTHVQPARETVHTKGIASWYGTGPGRGHAAAGGALRRFLGPHWRGTRLRVCTTRCVTVVVDDWCGCPGHRLIDLSPADFRVLGSLSRGLIAVTVTR